MTRWSIAFIGVLLLGGCVGVGTRDGVGIIEPSPPSTQDEMSGEHYQQEPGGDPEIVAAFRADPSPAQPEVSDGTDPVADKNALSAQRYVHIGTSRFGAGDRHVREQVDARARAIGADKVLIYPPSSQDQQDAGTVVTYFVRFKLSFGATFRDLTARERADAGVAGGIEIGNVIVATPAATANLLAGDIVVSIDGVAIAGKAAFQELLQTRAGRRVPLNVWRNGELVERVIRLGPARSVP